MSRQRKVKGKAQVEWKGFINAHIPKEHKKRAKEDTLKYEQYVQFLIDVGKAGYKVTTTFTNEGEFWTVSAYGNSPQCTNAGWSMSGRHSDILVAATVLYYLVHDCGWDTPWKEYYGDSNDNDW